ncbi:aminoacyl-tRNA hydrolase [Candidatus Berkelbacteria bacterium]|nr:aminoacyl-tRNA hydrolase [Candidatus Berkelbacteria bacterium]
MDLKLIVGLGNPGEEYTFTRHNVGWMVLDALIAKLGAGPWRANSEHEATLIQWVMTPQRFIFVKPTTFMNNSGRSLARLRAYYKLQTDDIVVVHDELDLPLGTVRIRYGGSSAGHNGVGSIIHQLGTDQFWRVRVGIGSLTPPQSSIDATDYVLDRFAVSERPLLQSTIDETVSSLVESIHTVGMTERSFTVTSPS